MDDMTLTETFTPRCSMQESQTKIVIGLSKIELFVLSEIFESKFDELI